MDQVLTAKFVTRNEPAVACLFPPLDDEAVVGLMVYRNFEQPNRSCFDNQDFPTMTAAMDYCGSKYDIKAETWAPIAEEKHSFAFSSVIDCAGVPQRQPTGLSGHLVLEIYKDGEKINIDLAGDHDGLRTFAKYLLLAAENATLDPEWHHHFAFGDGVELTLRSPSSFSAKDNGCDHHHFED